MSAFPELQGRVAVVTGGASGIGKGIATQLLANGMQVIIADIEPNALEATARELGATGIRCDVSDCDSVRALANEVMRRFGAVHVLCNNAGVGSTGNLADLSLADWRWVLGVNLWGVIHGTHVFLPLLQANAVGGHIVNTSSLGGLGTIPGLGAYAVSKHGVVALSESLAQELQIAGSKVGVTVLCPGTVSTNIKASSRNRPADPGPTGLMDTDLEHSDFGAGLRWMHPNDVGRIVVRAIRQGDLHAFTHPEMFASIEERFRSIVAANAAQASRAR